MRTHFARGAVAIVIGAVTLAVVVIASAAYGSSSSSSNAPRLAASATVTPSGVATSAAATRRPNIVFVLTDDLTADLLRFMPHVRRMQRRGVTMKNFFVADSLCCPSRTATLTGLYPHNNGVFRNSGADGGYDGFNAHGNVRKTYGLALQRAQYRTGLMGKYLNHYEPTDGVPRGWTEWAVAGSGYREFDYQLNVNGTIHSYGHEPRDYLTDVLARKARGFIRRSASAGKPFALEIAPFAPHMPGTPAARDADKLRSLTAPRGPAWNRLPSHAPSWLANFPRLGPADRQHMGWQYRRRALSVLAVDRLVGKVQDTLTRLGIADNTYVVFSSDNGYHLGEHRLEPGKQTAFDTDIRVPLIVTGPGVPAGRTVSALAANIDLAPTFEQIGHARHSITRDGTSLLDLWHGKRATAGWRRAVLIEHHNRRFALDDPDRQGTRAGNAPSYEAIRTHRALYVEYATGDTEYYDLRSDPAELHNLADTAPPAVLAGLRATLDRLTGCRGPSSCA
jgi:N-acetylglucosamine-6-sulfatase